MYNISVKYISEKQKLFIFNIAYIDVVKSSFDYRSYLIATLNQHVLSFNAITHIHTRFCNLSKYLAVLSHT